MSAGENIGNVIDNPKKLDFYAAAKGRVNKERDIKIEYNLVYFVPNSSKIGQIDTNKCMAVSEYENLPSIAMKKIDENLHTADSCRLNVGMMQSAEKWQDFIGNKKPAAPTVNNRGLKFRVVGGYFNNNPDFFKNARVLHSGVATGFGNITQSTNGFIRTPNSRRQHRYSVEWYGTFTPTIDGSWYFYTASDDASFVWIGKYAISNMSANNAIVKNGGLHAWRGAAGVRKLKAGRAYPIRLQFGENWGGHNFQFRTWHHDGRRWIEKPVIDFLRYDIIVKDTNLYYSLVEETPELSSQGLYNCYISDLNSNNVSKTQNNFRYKTIWSAFDEEFEISNLQPDNYAQNRNGTLIIYSGSGNIIKQFELSQSGNQNTTIKLDNTGNLILRGTPYTSVNAQGAVVNNLWKTEKDILNRKDYLANGERIQRKSWDNQELLISENGMFKLEINENGNLVIKESLSGCSGKTTDGTTYTTKQDNKLGENYYLYEVNADMKLDKSFVAQVTGDKRELKPLNTNSVNMRKSNRYNKYDNYAPTKTHGTILGNRVECQTKCTNDDTCDYYYSYTTDDGKENCITGKNSDGLKTFIPVQPNSGIKSSQLYIRNTEMNLEKNDIRSAIPDTNTTNYDSYAAYKVSPALYEIGASQIMQQEYIDLRDREQTLFLGTGKTNVEGFNNHGYQSKEAVYGKYGEKTTEKGLNGGINDEQISPLRAIAGDYNSLMQQINSEYNNIGSVVADTIELRDNLKADTNSGYLDENYDTTPQIKKVADVRLDDINEMISQTNTTYTLGTVTAITLIIAGIFIMRK